LGVALDGVLAGKDCCVRRRLTSLTPTVREGTSAWAGDALDSQPAQRSPGSRRQDEGRVGGPTEGRRHATTLPGQERASPPKKFRETRNFYVPRFVMHGNEHRRRSQDAPVGCDGGSVLARIMHTTGFLATLCAAVVLMRFG